jgi:hypothetical protein
MNGTGVRSFHMKGVSIATCRGLGCNFDFIGAYEVTSFILLALESEVV